MRSTVTTGTERSSHQVGFDWCPGREIFWSTAKKTFIRTEPDCTTRKSHGRFQRTISCVDLSPVQGHRRICDPDLFLMAFVDRIAHVFGAPFEMPARIEAGHRTRRQGSAHVESKVDGR